MMWWSLDSPEIEAELETVHSGVNVQVTFKFSTFPHPHHHPSSFNSPHTSTFLSLISPLHISFSPLLPFPCLLSLLVFFFPFLSPRSFLHLDSTSHSSLLLFFSASLWHAGCLLKISFLATLVALHFTPVSKSVSGRSFGLQPSSVAWSLRACFSSPCPFSGSPVTPFS